MTDESPPVPSADPRLQRLLRLALALTGGSWAAVVLDDGEIEAATGPAPVGVDACGLAPLARGGRAPQGVVAAPAPGADAVLAVAGGQAAAASADQLRALADLAALTADELTGDARDAREERDTLLAEIDHRVKNVLSAVQSMASQSARRALSLDGFLKAFTGRLRAMASAQELLTASRWRGASIHDLATATLSTLAPGQTRWEGPDLFLTPRAANALALALHELALNAARYGALSVETGRVDLRWRGLDRNGFELEWLESGGPVVSPPVRKGFGALLLDDVTGKELDGEVFSEFRASGVRVRINGSAKALAEPQAEAAPVSGPDAASAGESIGPPAKETASKVQGMRVIIVEDAVLLAMELEAGLSEAGAEVLGSAALVEEAMALVDLPIDAAVLDCNLNGLSVQPVAEALAARGVPFIFATGYGENRGAPEGFDAPVIRKPYDVAQIAAALAELTGRA